MNRMSRLLLTGTLSLIAVAAGAVAVIDDEPVEERQKLRLVWNQDGEKDQLKIEELDLEVGESREFTTEGGRSAKVTREEKGYSLDLDGKTMRILDDPHELGAGERRVLKKILEIDGESPGELGEECRCGHHRMSIGEKPHLSRHRMHRIEIGEGGEGKHFVIREGGPEMMFIEGEPGEHSVKIRRLGLPGHSHEEMIERIEKSEKFQALDDATRETVLDIVREAMPKMKKLEWFDAESDVHDLDVILEQRVEKKKKVEKDDD